MPRLMTLMATAMVATLIAAATATAAAYTPRPCPRDAVAGARCATLTVPLDRSGAVPGTLHLPVVVVPASGKAPRRGPLLMLAGGPGQAGIAPAAYARFLATLAPGYDIVEFDQRGTGATALRCSALAGEEVNLDVMPAGLDQIGQLFGACAQQLGPARRFFTSADSADDIDDLRAALGADQLTLGGTSYGSWVSQVYARRYPTRVRRLILDSVVGPQGVQGIALAEYAGARRILHDMCPAQACPGVGNPVADTERLEAQLENAPIRGHAVTSRGTRQTLSFGGPQHAGVLANLFYAGDLDAELRAAFPAAVASALHGDPAMLLRLAAIADDEKAPAATEISPALFAATTCAETALPWAGSDSTEQRRNRLAGALQAVPAGALAPWGAATVLANPAIGGCVQWPDSPFTAPPSSPLPDVPALVLNGLDDVRTPIESARAVAAQLPSATVVAIPGQGHSVISQPCAQQALHRFLVGRAVSTRVCARAPLVAPHQVPPRSLSRLRSAASGRRGTAKRSAKAARLAVRDALGFVDVYGIGRRFPGLRAGTARYRDSDRDPLLRLDDYEYVPGVRVSGTLHLSKGLYGQVRVRGSRSAHGTLRIHDGVAHGRLGGIAVTQRFRRR